MDKYKLEQSKEFTITDIQPNIRVDLQLKKNKNYNNIIIFGCIINLSKKVIDNATVSFFDKYNKKIDSVCTNEKGIYIYMGIKRNSIVRISVEKQGYNKKESCFFRSCSKKFKYNICLRKDKKVNKTLISGHIIDENNKHLKDICVYLLMYICNKLYIYKATNSNIYGQFIFPKIVIGKYIIMINDFKYHNYKKKVIIVKNKYIYSVDIILKEKIQG